MIKEIKETGLYISDNGKVYNKDFKEVNTFINACGYRSILINGIPQTIAFIVAKYFIPNPNECFCVIHINGDIKDDRAVNLQWYGYIKEDYTREEFEEYKQSLLEEYEEAEDYEKVEKLLSSSVGGIGRGLRNLYKCNTKGDVIAEYKSVKDVMKDKDIKGKISQGVLDHRILDYLPVDENYIICKLEDYNKYRVIKAFEIWNETKEIRYKKVQNLARNLDSRKPRKIAQYDLTGNLIKVFNSRFEAAEENNINANTLATVLYRKDRNDLQFRGFIWGFYDE